jgi:hypothetical protein
MTLKCEWIENPEAKALVGCDSPAVVVVKPVGWVATVPAWVQEFRLCLDHKERGREYLADLLKVEVEESPC